MFFLSTKYNVTQWNTMRSQWEVNEKSEINVDWTYILWKEQKKIQESSIALRIRNIELWDITSNLLRQNLVRDNNPSEANQVKLIKSNQSGETNSIKNCFKQEATININAQQISSKYAQSMIKLYPKQSGKEFLQSVSSKSIFRVSSNYSVRMIATITSHENQKNDKCC